MQTQDNSYITLKDIWEFFIGNVLLFVASIVICLGGAFTYLAITTPTYQRTASILIKEDATTQSISGAIGEMGITQPKTDLNNEIQILSMPSLMAEVVKRLSLNYNYGVKFRGLRWVDLYRGAPFVVKFDESLEDSSVSFFIRIEEDGSFELDEFTINGSAPISIEGRYGVPIKCGSGEMTIESAGFTPGSMDSNLYSFSKKDVLSAAYGYSALMSIGARGRESSIIDMSIVLGSKEKAEDILNTLISVYNENWIKDKNLVTVSTSNFINERLAIIGNELGAVDKTISNYKSDNLLPNVESVMGMNLAATNASITKQVDLNNQLSMAKYILDYMSDRTTSDKLLPVNFGIEAEGINSQIQRYNELLLKKNNLLSNSSTNNPVVSEMITTLAQMKETLILAVNDFINTINIQLSMAQKEQMLAQQKLAENPEQELYLLSTGREQAIKEQLYLFLLQKREENALSQAFTAYNTKVLSLARGSNIPVNPKKNIVYLFGLALGFILPILYLVIRAALQTTVKSKEDLASLSTPFLGSIPQISKKKLKESEEHHSVVISLKKSRDGVNESFRVVRTNLDFILDQDQKCKTTMVTSFNPKSGKSFVVTNLALSMATKDNRVLVIDGDFRRGTLSEIVDSPNIGVVNYINDNNLTIEDIIQKRAFHPMLDVLPMGSIPPNPTELLLKKRFEELIEQLKERYEYIFFDCPPLEIVPDAAIIEKYCDASIFVIRSGLLDKRLLPDVEKLYESKRLKNMSIILNGVSQRSKYGYGKYGYGKYGYGYGYGSYGYGSYGSNKVSDKK